MTPDELRKLADEATPGRDVFRDYAKPYRKQKPETQERLQRADDAGETLAALAPDLARLCAENDDAFREILDLVMGWSKKMGESEMREGLHGIATAALAKLSELEP